MEGSVFILSGEEHSLPFAEIRALLGTYCRDATCERLSRRVVFSNLNKPETVRKISQRAAYTRFGGSLISLSTRVNNLADDIRAGIIADGKSFAVNSETLERDVYADIGGQIKEKTNAKVSLENPDYVFQAEKIDDGRFVLGVTDQGFKKFTWRERRPRARKFFLPSAIYPKLARLLVNLSRVKEGEYFLDPFCGTGSLLIEGSVMNIKAIGFDLTRWIARGARLNLEGFGLHYESIIRADSTFQNLPLRKIDAISTDVPYGRASSTKGKDTLQIIREFLAATVNVLTSDKYCVLMHPSNIEFDFRKSYDLAEQHMLYVHRNLTRAISVLRRR